MVRHRGWLGRAALQFRVSRVTRDDHGARRAWDLLDAAAESQVTSLAESLRVTVPACSDALTGCSAPVMPHGNPSANSGN